MYLNVLLRVSLRERGDKGGGSAHTECVGREVFSNIPPPLLHLNDEREMTANFVTTCFFLGGGFFDNCLLEFT